MSSRSRIMLLGGLVVAGAVVLVLSSDRLPDPVRVGRPAPAWVGLTALDGKPYSLSELRGRVVFLNFWATWCKPCEDEMPAMQHLYDTLGAQQFEMVAISVDDDREAVEAFRDRLGLTFPILLDSDKRVSRAYQATKFPETFLIDADGTLISRFIGPKDWDSPTYLDHIRSLVARSASR